MSSRSVTFLIVEDDDIDVKALRRAFKELKLANPVRVAHDGVEALELLRGETITNLLNGRIWSSSISICRE